MNIWLRTLIVLALLAMGSNSDAQGFGKAFKQRMKENMGMAQPEAQSVTVEQTAPKLTLVGESNTIAKGGVVVQATPEAFISEVKQRTECKQRQATMVVNDQYPYDVFQVPYATVRPDNVEFKISITNKLKNVLKLDGAIFVLSAGGNEIEIESGSIAAFHKGRILPGKSQDFTIRGPSWKTLVHDSAVSLAIYDITTAVDPAGNVAERGSFEWDFVFTKESRTETAVIETQVVKMTSDQARATCH